MLFGPVLFTDRSFAMRDAAHFYYPLFEWCCREWAAGRVPLWNPYENCGLPVLADASSSVFYPGKLLFLLPVDFALRYKLYVVAARRARGRRHRTRSRGTGRRARYAAAVAAIAYACGGNVVFQYCNVVFLVGAAWLPLAALAADRMLRERSVAGGGAAGRRAGADDPRRRSAGGLSRAADHRACMRSCWRLAQSADEPQRRWPVVCRELRRCSSD